MEMQHLNDAHIRLHAWYQQHGRHHLPWRNNTDPYAIYISEVMLQQTQVQTVLERYYFPFLAQFPSLQALADANQEEVLKAWQGLGYYSRAVNLHKAAQLASPALPLDVEGLLALPGIGRNTAHAVAAFGYHLPVPVMEANVKRLIYRIFALENATDAELWEKAFTLLDSNNPFDYNQAVMDVGAMVCTRIMPRCQDCPLNNICIGKEAPERYPTKKPKKPVPIIPKIIVAFRDNNGRYHLTPRTTRFLYGLYGFAEYSPEEAIIFEGTTYQIATLEYLGNINQSYSHFTLTAECYLCPLSRSSNSISWYAPVEIGKLPLSRADSKVEALIGRMPS